MAFTPGLGVKVTRAAAALGTAIGSPHSIFTIAGGIVLVTNLIGRVTVVMDATASTLRFAHSVGPTNISGALAAIANDGVGTIYAISGDFADLAYKGLAGVPVRGGFSGGLAAGAGVIANGILMFTGNITYTNSGDQTGQVEWIAYYLPITDGATLVAA